MDSAQILIVNAQVFCLLGLLIPCLAGTIHILFLRQSQWTGWHVFGSLCLLLITLWSLNIIYNLVVEAQDINPECVGHSDPRYKDCSYDGSLSYAEEKALRRSDIFWDTMEYVVAPTIISVGVLVYIMKLIVHRYSQPRQL
jgi:hypothetical protein